MRELIKDVAAFQLACDQPVRGEPTFIQSEMEFRMRFTHEEVQETKDAIDDSDLTKVADGLGDIMYVLSGSAAYFGLHPEQQASTVIKATLSRLAHEYCEAVAEKNARLVEALTFQGKIICLGIAAHYGIPFPEVWAIIHGANMAKVDPVTGKVTKNDEGKVLKPVGWVPPDPQIARLLHSVGLIQAEPDPSLFD